MRSQRSLQMTRSQEALFYAPSLVLEWWIPLRHVFLVPPLLGDVASVSDTLSGKIHALEVMGDRLGYMSAHDALILLRNSFSIPKLLHILRTSPAFLSPALATYDESLQSIVSSITNIKFEPDDPAWTQATLPIGVGGLGISSLLPLPSWPQLLPRVT